MVNTINSFNEIFQRYYGDALREEMERPRNTLQGLWDRLRPASDWQGGPLVVPFQALDQSQQSQDPWCMEVQQQAIAQVDNHLSDALRYAVHDEAMHINFGGIEDRLFAEIAAQGERRLFDALFEASTKKAPSDEPSKELKKFDSDMDASLKELA